MSEETQSLGSVKGRLELEHEFVLYPPVENVRVRCTLNVALVRPLFSALGRNVTIHGMCHYGPDSAFPFRIEAADIEVHPPDEELPTLDDLRGMAPNSTGDLDSVAFVRKIRDREDEQSPQPAESEDRPIEKVLQELTEEIPTEEWKKVGSIDNRLGGLNGHSLGDPLLNWVSATLIFVAAGILIGAIAAAIVGAFW